MLADVRYFQARHLATMTTRGVIENGVIAVADGRIVEIGSKAELRPPRIDETFDGLISPGLVNAHTHLELSDRFAGEMPTGGFAAWLIGMLQRSATAPGELEGLVTLGVGIGVRQCLEFGVTAVGDISRLCHITRPLLARTPLRVVSFGEVQAMGQNRGFLDQRLAAAANPADETARLRVGISPHAPYSVEPDGYRACLETARCNGFRALSTHLAESADEADFLRDHSGPFRGLWDWLGRFDDRVPTFEGGSIALAESLGLLAYPTLLAHVNYCDAADLQRLANGQASVVWCPRTHAYFGHPPHRWRDMRAAGINVCVGTDSCASSPDLNLMDDLRLVRRQSPDESPESLWRLVTSAAADALRWGDGLGRLTPGGYADFVHWPTTSADPLAEVLDRPNLRPAGPIRINGEPVTQ
ncbi:MAG: amidohydrolase family protein [Tepidisphaeraceae bacterium]